MPVPSLYAAQPLTINKTYDKVWVEEIVISAPDPNADASARVRLRLFRDNNGERELAPEVIRMSVEGIMASASADQELDSAVTALMGYIGRKAAQEGIVADIP